MHAPTYPLTQTPNPNPQPLSRPAPTQTAAGTPAAGSRARFVTGVPVRSSATRHRYAGSSLFKESYHLVWPQIFVTKGVAAAAREATLSFFQYRSEQVGHPIRDLLECDSELEFESRAKCSSEGWRCYPQLTHLFEEAPSDLAERRKDELQAWASAMVFDRTDTNCLPVAARSWTVGLKVVSPYPNP